jgi:hypothetical protein
MNMTTTTTQQKKELFVKVEVMQFMFKIGTSVSIFNNSFEYYVNEDKMFPIYFGITQPYEIENKKKSIKVLYDLYKTGQLTKWAASDPRMHAYIFWVMANILLESKEIILMAFNAIKGRPNLEYVHDYANKLITRLEPYPFKHQIPYAEWKDGGLLLIF